VKLIKVKIIQFINVLVMICSLQHIKVYTAQCQSQCTYSCNGVLLFQCVTKCIFVNPLTSKCCSTQLYYICLWVGYHLVAPASVAQWAESRTQCALTRTVCRSSRGSIPGSAGRFRVWISGTHALRLISRAGKEGSTVSSIICDRWLILS